MFGLFDSMLNIAEDAADILLAPAKVAVDIVEPVVHTVAEGANAVVETVEDLTKGTL